MVADVGRELALLPPTPQPLGLLAVIGWAGRRGVNRLESSRSVRRAGRQVQIIKSLEALLTQQPGIFASRGLT